MPFFFFPPKFPPRTVQFTKINSRKEIAAQYNIENAYQLQKLTGFSPSKSANLWRGEWELAHLGTLNTLCNLLSRTPNEILEFPPDKDE